ncbi:methyltransferase domain-containing protein, partial [Spirillospora sp. NPDC046719]
MGPTIELDSRTTGAIDGRHIRALTFQDVRLEYVGSVLRRLGIDPAGRSALVVGSGRGLLARGLAGLGLTVVALDPSPEATAMAREAGTAGGGGGAPRPPRAPRGGPTRPRRRRRTPHPQKYPPDPTG